MPGYFFWQIIYHAYLLSCQGRAKYQPCSWTFLNISWNPGPTVDCKPAHSDEEFKAIQQLLEPTVEWGIEIKTLYIHILEKEMATHSSTLAWKTPWTEEPGRLQSMGSLRVGHDWATSLSLFPPMHWKRKWQPPPVFLPGESQGRGSLVGCLPLGSHRVGHDWSDLSCKHA